MKNNTKILGMLIKKNRLEQNMSQEGLCQGICAVSYLSKIEKGTIICSEEILRQLLDVLGISLPTDIDLTIYENKINDFFHYYFFDNKDKVKDIMNELKEKSSVLAHSNLAIDMMLVEAYWSYLFGSNDKENINNIIRQLLPFKHYMNEIQTYRLYIIMGQLEGFINHDYHSSLNYFTKAKNNTPEGFALAGVVAAHYGLGNYLDSIVLGEEAYIKLTQEGNIEFAIYVCNIIAASYANYRDVEKMAKYFKRAISLIKSDVNSARLGHVYYNLGSGYLVTANYSEAIKYFNLSYEILNQLINSDTRFYIYLLQKLFLANFAIGKKQQAGYYLKLSEQCYKDFPEQINIALKASLKWLQKMYTIENYLYNKEYLNAIKDLYEVSINDTHRGYTLLYADYLVDTYKKQRKYKEALKVTEYLHVKSQFS
ncbi:helix-turn-helix transcriptional regulator [Proteinivorax tanatarense]|uniref:Helix-turn-helix transcriptional regulator n=1 Tax=Proteinivorax tanatarense TaxID=1260629 RepID=A0AAU7VJW7_9FIRM